MEGAILRNKENRLNGERKRNLHSPEGETGRQKGEETCRHSLLRTERDGLVNRVRGERVKHEK